MGVTLYGLYSSLLWLAAPRAARRHSEAVGASTWGTLLSHFHAQGVKCTQRSMQRSTERTVAASSRSSMARPALVGARSVTSEPMLPRSSTTSGTACSLFVLLFLSGKKQKFQRRCMHEGHVWQAHPLVAECGRWCLRCGAHRAADTTNAP